MKKIEQIKIARKLLYEITRDDLREHVGWLRQVRMAQGYLDTAIKLIEKKK